MRNHAESQWLFPRTAAGIQRRLDALGYSLPALGSLVRTRT